jgi:Xaa-Pro aminopeptidase
MCAEPLRSAASHRARQERLRALLESRRVSRLLVTRRVNVCYLTGFTGSAGAVLLGQREAVLWVDPRYTLQAREEACGVEVFEEKKGILNGVARWFEKNRVRECAYEAADLTCAQFEQLRAKAGKGLRWRPAEELVEELRVVKDVGEIEAIRQAGRVTAEAWEETLPLVRPGVAERDLAAEIDYRMRRKGAQGSAFETIVASGPRAACPHASPSAKALQESELVIFDLGAILSDYAADMTRTVFLGEPGTRVRKLYSAVVRAQGEAVRAVRDGVRAGRVDLAARRALAKCGLARYFTHSTGHGVGLEIHERPRLGRGVTTALRAGSIVTVEPGIYLPDWGGIRIEDTVLVTPDGAEILTPASKESWIVR